MINGERQANALKASKIALCGQLRARPKFQPKWLRTEYQVNNVRVHDGRRGPTFNE